MFGVVSLTMGNSPFPFADGLGTQAQRLCQFPLGHLPLLPQTADQGADFWIVHVLTSFNSIADFAARDNRRFVDPCGGKIRLSARYREAYFDKILRFVLKSGATQKVTTS